MPVLALSLPQRPELSCLVWAKRVSPTILTDQLSCLSPMLSSSPNGHCWVHIGYVKTSKANWFVALTRLASDRGLVQIIDSLCKYVFAATVSANLSSSITDSLTPRNLYLVPVLSFSTRVTSSSLRFAACSSCLPFLTWLTTQTFGFHF